MFMMTDARPPTFVMINAMLNSQNIGDAPFFNKADLQLQQSMPVYGVTSKADMKPDLQ